MDTQKILLNVSIVKTFALSFCKLPSFVCRIEISDILVCLTLDGNVTTVLLLEALQRLMPSVGTVVYSVTKDF